MARVIAGADVLRQQLESLKTNAARNALRFATRKAAEIVRTEAEARAPVGSVPHKTYKGRLVPPGFLSRSVKTAVTYSRDSGTVRAAIGPTAEAFYGTQFLEVGTSKMPKQPWLVPAYTASLGEVEATFVRELKNAVERAIKRGNVR